MEGEILSFKSSTPLLPLPHLHTPHNLEKVGKYFQVIVISLGPVSPKNSDNKLYMG